MSSKSDLELVKEFQAGKVEAFNELVRRYQQKVYWIAHRIIGNHNDADDITQDVFVKVYKSLENFRSESSFYTWIYRIASNMAISSIRRKKIINLIKFDDAFSALNSIADENISALDNMELKENRILIEEAIAQLPPRQKKVFIMRYYDELPYEEISKILNKQVSGLKANYFHALKNIKNFMRKKSQL